MTRITFTSQDKIAETMLTALYMRALEASRPEPLLRDLAARRLVEQIDYDFTRLKLNKLDQVSTILRVREFDRRAADFLSRFPDSIVVNIGCGLDTRFERVDNGRVRWFDLDLPEVIELRKQLIPEIERCSMLACSVFDPAWLEVLSNSRHACLFLAEGVLPYFTEEQVKGLFFLFRDRFPGCELVCDGMTPTMLRIHNLELSVSKVKARLNWALTDGHQPESWGNGIRLLSEWFYFDQPEPRLGLNQLMRYIPPLAKGVGIFHYQLGTTPG